MQALRTTFHGQTVEITDVPSGSIVALGAHAGAVTSKPQSNRLPGAQAPQTPQAPQRPVGSTEDIQCILAEVGGMEVVPASSVMIARPQPKGTTSQYGAISDSGHGMRPVTQSGRQQRVDGHPGTRSGRISPHPAARRGTSANSASRLPAGQRRKPSPALPVIIGVVALLAVGVFVALANSRSKHAAVHTSHAPEAVLPPPVASAATSQETALNAGGAPPTGPSTPANGSAPASPQTIDPIVSNGLVAWYRFADYLHPGRDDSGNGRHSELVNSGLTVVADEQTGTALQLEGNGRMVIPSPISSDFTILVWVNTIQDGHDGTPFEVDLAQWYWGIGIVDGDVVGLVDDFGMAILGGRLTFGLGARTEATVFGAQRIDSGTWHHLAVTRSNHGEIHLYVDGQNDGVFNGPSGARGSTKVLSLGAIATSPNRFLRGRMADLRFYDRVLGAAEVGTVLHALRALRGK